MASGRSNRYNHTLLFTRNPSPLQANFLLSYMASTKDTTPILTGEQDALQLLISLPARRQLSQSLNSDELGQLSFLLMEFLKSPDVRKAPSKGHLTIAVNALLLPGAKPVSPKWNKPQLAGVLQRWVDEAQVLPNPEHQQKLYLEVKSTNGRHKEIDLNKAIFTHEEDGSLATFALSSPDSRKSADEGVEPVPLTQPQLDDAILASLEFSPVPMGTPSSIRTSASSQIRRVHNVARLNELMELANSCETAGAGSEAGEGEPSPTENPKTGLRAGAEKISNAIAQIPEQIVNKHLCLTGPIKGTEGVDYSDLPDLISISDSSDSSSTEEESDVERPQGNDPFSTPKNHKRVHNETQGAYLWGPCLIINTPLVFKQKLTTSHNNKS